MGATDPAWVLPWAAVPAHDRGPQLAVRVACLKSWGFVRLATTVDVTSSGCVSGPGLAALGVSVEGSPTVVERWTVVDEGQGAGPSGWARRL